MASPEIFWTEILGEIHFEKDSNCRQNGQNLAISFLKVGQYILQFLSGGFTFELRLTCS